MIKDHIDILVISETKIDSSFPENQFCIEGYNPPFRLDITQEGGGGGGIRFTFDQAF